TRSKRDWSSDVCSSDLINQDGLTLIFGGEISAEYRVDPVTVNIPLDKLYLHINEDIEHYINLSETQKTDMTAAIQEEKERILREKRSEEHTSELQSRFDI